MTVKNIRFKINPWCLITLILLFVFGCDDDMIAPEDRPICPALNVNSATEFFNNNNSAVFEQLDNEHSNFIFTSPSVSNPFDGENVIELKFARVEFDFEDEEVDPHDLGGFWARWKIVLIPFDSTLVREFQQANSSVDRILRLQRFINALRENENRTEAELAGPFLSDTEHCEWGDTDELGTQTLEFLNYGIYDWDFFPQVGRVIGVIFEGDEGIGDDFIAWLDVSKNSGEVTVEEPQKYRVIFTSNSNISLKTS